MLKCTLFVYIIIQLAPFVNPQKKVANVTTFNPFLSRGTYLSSVGFITVPSNTPESKKRVPTALSFGGGKGIRTLVRLLSNGFQDRLVMTTSISLRIKTELWNCIRKNIRRKNFAVRKVRVFPSNTRLFRWLLPLWQGGFKTASLWPLRYPSV